MNHQRSNFDAPSWDELLECLPPSLDASDAIAFLREECETLRIAPPIDLDSDEARDLVETRLAADREIGRRIADVAAPEGLADRILANLSPAVADVLSSPRPAARRDKRRRLLWAGAIAAVAASVCGVLITCLEPATVAPITLAAAPESAIEHFDRETSDLSEGELLTDAPCPERYAFPRYVHCDRDVRWRRVDDFLGREAVAFDLRIPGSSGRATVYAVHNPGESRAVAGLPSREPLLQTRNRCVSLWQSQDTLYVLVVEGDPRHYRGLLDLPHGPLT